MKSDLFRLTIAVLLALGFAAGCHSTATQEVPETMPARQDTGQKLAAENAIANAKAALMEAEAVGYAWRDTKRMLQNAEKAMQEGDYAKAESLANAARVQSENALNQHYLEQARLKRAALAEAGMSATELAELDAALRSVNGLRAFRIASRLESSMASRRMAYTIIKGDSLWGIAGKREIYNNSYYWPLIYKANRNVVKDADLIYPGQELAIDMNPSSTEIKQAVSHARSRGAWSIGPVETFDMGYISR